MVRKRWKRTFIYGLKDPRTGDIRYIGKSNDPARRLEQHLEDTKNQGKLDWLSELQGLGLQPEIVILDTVNRDEWRESEKQWIADGWEQGWPLLNIGVGGEGGWLADYDRFAVMRDWLLPQDWAKYQGLPTKQRGDIMVLVAKEVVHFSCLAIRARGGIREKHCIPELGAIAGSGAAHRLVVGSEDGTYDALAADINVAYTRLIRDIAAYVEQEYGNG